MLVFLPSLGSTNLIADALCSVVPDEEGERGPRGKRAKVFEEHLKFSAVANGIKAGELVQGKLTTQRKYPFEGTVSAGKQVRAASAACACTLNA